MLLEVMGLRATTDQRALSVIAALYKQDKITVLKLWGNYVGVRVDQGATGKNAGQLQQCYSYFTTPDV